MTEYFTNIIIPTSMPKDIKLVALGHDGPSLPSGKTKLLFTYTENWENPDAVNYVPAVFDNTTKVVRASNGEDVNVCLWDTSGQGEVSSSLRPLSYPDTEVFLVVFDLTDKTSLAGCKVWFDATRDYCSSCDESQQQPVPLFVLVGTHASDRMLGVRGHVSTAAGDAAMLSFGAHAYRECSAVPGKESEGVEEIFTAAVDLVLKERRREQQPDVAEYTNNVHCCYGGCALS